MCFPLFCLKEKKEKSSKMLVVLCSPYLPHEVELTGAESLQSPILTGLPAPGASGEKLFAPLLGGIS